MSCTPHLHLQGTLLYAGRDAACSLTGSFLSIDVDARAAGARVGVEAVDSTLTQGCSSA